jgi:hypothetical protein
VSLGAFIIAAILLIGLKVLESGMKRVAERIDNNSQLLSDIKDKLP